MPHSRRLCVALAALALLAPASRAGDPPSPLRLVPAEADLVFTVPDPRRLADTAMGLDLLRHLDTFSAYREALDSTRFRHFKQFVAYYEKEMGAPWPQILDEVAGGGIAVGVKVGKNPAPTLLVIQGRDEKRVQQFARLALQLAETEAARQDEKARPTKGTIEGVEYVGIAGKFFAAVVGPAILVSNDEHALGMGINLHLGRGGKSHANRTPPAVLKEAGREPTLKDAFERGDQGPHAADAAGLLPPDALATVWFNLESARRNPAVGAVLKTAPRDDPAQTILFGGYLDVLGRSPYVCGALVRDGNDLLLTVRMPRGRNGMGPDSLLHVPPAGSAECRPLLEPKGVLFSTRFYLDVARIWQDRDKIFPEKVAKSFEKADKGTNPLLAGLRISKILPQVGAYHRFVAARPSPASYASPAGGPPVPAFALVSELRQPEDFAKAMEATLRGAALLTGFRVKMKQAEEKVGDVKLVGFRFAEDQPQLDENTNNLLRYYSPCFARVGDQFLWCSTMDFGRELVGILQAEKKGSPPQAVQSRVYGAGGADYLALIEDALVAQAVLDRALPTDRAAAEVKAALALLRSLGPLNLDARYEDERFCYDFRLKGLK